MAADAKEVAGRGVAVVMAAVVAAVTVVTLAVLAVVGLDARGLAKPIVLDVLIHVNLNVGVRVRLVAGELPSNI